MSAAENKRIIAQAFYSLARADAADFIESRNAHEWALVSQAPRPARALAASAAVGWSLRDV